MPKVKTESNFGKKPESMLGRDWLKLRWSEVCFQTVSEVEEVLTEVVELGDNLDWCIDRVSQALKKVRGIVDLNNRSVLRAINEGRSLFKNLPGISPPEPSDKMISGWSQKSSTEATLVKYAIEWATPIVANQELDSCSDFLEEKGIDSKDLRVYRRPLPDAIPDQLRDTINNMESIVGESEEALKAINDIRYLLGLLGTL